MHKSAKRCWICSYLLWNYPFTKYQRWFYTRQQAESFINRQQGVMLKDIRHA